MRRFLSLFTVLMLCGVLAFAQSRVVSGRVTDASGNPVPFASVKLKGSRTGISADANGVYTIRVKDGDVLEVTGTGFKEVDVPVGTLTNITTVMEPSTRNDLKEVVVTGAFNTKRAARSTSSNVQNVTGDQLNTIRQTNINNALAGKVAGLQVRSQASAALGRDNVVRLRGENGIGIGGGALYVVDGTIIPSANDINPDDIEDVTVLQGPAASALFGPDGANGAIVVNTKKAKRGQRNIGIEINTGVQFDNVYILPDYQNTYGGGTDRDFRQYHYKAGDPEGWKVLDGLFYPDYTEDVSWGPKMVGQTYIPWYAWYQGHERSFQTAQWVPQPHNARDFFNTGVTKTNNINFSKGGEGYNFRASYTNLDQQGLIPTSYLKRNTFTMNGSIDLGSKFTFGANITYLNQRTNAENDDTYGNTTIGSFNQWFHRDLDMGIMKELRNLRGPNGELATWNHNNPEAYNVADKGASFYKAYYWHSPYAWLDNVYNFTNRDRVFGDASITFKPNNDIRLRFTYRKQQLTTNSDTRQYYSLDLSAGSNSGFNYWEAANGRARSWGGYALGYSTSNRQNYEFLASYSKKVRDFAINANAGVDILRTSLNQFNANTMGGLFVPNLFTLANSKNPINSTNTIQNLKRRSLFVRADIGYKNFLFLEGTFRRDYISTEQPSNPYLDAKSAGASFVFSDLINKGGNTFLSYGKIRGSIGQIINPLGIYQNQSLYTFNATTLSGNLLTTEPGTLQDPALHGAVQTEKEVGLELRFWNSRIGINATYWDRTNKDFPINATLYPGTGYTSVATNAGRVDKTGIDIQLSLNPFRMKNFDWNINATWGRLLKNDVIEIAPQFGINDVTTELSGNGNISMKSVVGQRWGQLWGKGIKRFNGKPVLTSDGLYIAENNTVFGSSLPDYTGGVQNTFNIFKNFILNVNIDFSYGGKFFSLSDWYGSGTGLTAKTAGLNDKGNPIRDPVADGGGIHVFGDDGTGKAVDYYVEARDYFEQNGLYGASIVEESMYDMTFVKMREVSFGYRIPVEKLGIGKYVKNATFSIVSRNPWLIYVKGKGFDPSELQNNASEDAQFPGTRSLGFNLKIGF